MVNLVYKINQSYAQHKPQFETLSITPSVSEAGIHTIAYDWLGYATFDTILAFSNIWLLICIFININPLYKRLGCRYCELNFNMSLPITVWNEKKTNLTHTDQLQSINQGLEMDFITYHKFCAHGIVFLQKSRGVLCVKPVILSSDSMY